MNEYQLGKDVALLEARVRALETKLGGHEGGCGCGGGEASAASAPRKARETDQEPTEGLTMRPDPMAPLAECTDAHIRTVSVNGRRYCQMCCGGKWQYFCWSNGECVRPEHGPVTVNCNGKNWILDCI